MELSRGQIKRLRAEGHRQRLKPVVTIGSKGLSDSLQAEIDRALGHHELVKLRIPPLARTDKRALGESICQQHGALLVESIGNVIVIYRRNAEKDRYAALLQARA